MYKIVIQILLCKSHRGNTAGHDGGLPRGGVQAGRGGCAGESVYAGGEVDVCGGMYVVGGMYGAWQVASSMYGLNH